MRARSCRSRLERDDRLATGHTPGDPSELARVAERLEVEQDHIRLVVVLPPLEQVVRRDVRLVADRDEGRKAKLALRRLLEQREAEGPALRREADRPLRERVGRKRCVQADFGRGDAEAVGADQPGAVRPDEREQRFLTLPALGADFCETGRNDAERADADSKRRRCRVEYLKGRNADHRELDPVGDLLDRAVAAHSRDRHRAAIDGIDGSREPRGEHVAEQLSADRTAALRRTDHGDGCRLEERPQRGDDGLVISLVDTGAQRLRRADREPQLELTSVELLGQRETRVCEHADGPAVVGHHVGDEPLDPHPPRADCELLEQPGPDAAPLLVVRHREGHLGRLAPVETGEAGERDDLPFQRPDERADVASVLEEPADQIAVDAADAVEPQVAATVGEAREELDEGATIGGPGGRRRSVPPSRRTTSTTSSAGASIMSRPSRRPAAGAHRSWRRAPQERPAPGTGPCAGACA